MNLARFLITPDLSYAICNIRFVFYFGPGFRTLTSHFIRVLHGACRNRTRVSDISTQIADLMSARPIRISYLAVGIGSAF
jgi:hypothetical protein